MSASANKRPAGILVRLIQFEYPADLAAHWHPEKPEWSQVVNAASLLMPYLEPFFIERSARRSPACGIPR